jgi:hypothetical protein
MDENKGKTRTYGNDRKEQAWAFIAALQSQAIAESKGKNPAERVSIKRIDWLEKTRSTPQQGKKGTNPRLFVKTTLAAVKQLIEVLRGVKLSDDALRYVHNHSLREEFLGILLDQRKNTRGRGSENWHFILKLWHTDLNENEKRFNSEWKRRKSGDVERSEASDAGATPIDRLNLLDQREQESKARCIERWQATGVTEKEAEELANDSSVGAPPPHIQLCAGKLILLIGELGAGKSLIAERLFQLAIKQAKENANAPVPVYLEAREAAGRLQKAVEVAVSDVGNSQIQGTTVIVDGADEAGTALASKLLTEARILVKAWHKTTVIITSRPIPSFDRVEEAVSVLQLSHEDAYALVERFAKQTITAFTASKWPESVQNAIHRPLFAVLLGIFLREQHIGVPNSIGELLSSLVERSLGRETVDRASANKLLQQLAVRCVEYRGGPVHAAEVASRAELQPILDSRLVVERYGSKLGFPLPILTEWFAAQSLASGNPKPEYFVSNAEQLEYWRYPLITAIATFGHNQVSRLLVPIVENHPAFAAEIVNEGLASRFLDMPLPPWRECGRRLREAMQAWVNGINQPVAMLIAPVQDDGKIRTIGTQTQGAELKTGWYYGDEELDDVIQLPLSRMPSLPGWSLRIVEPVDRQSTRINQLSPQPAWAWRFTLNELVASLSKLLQRRALPINNGFLAHEALWQLARSVLMFSRRTSFRYYPAHRPIPIAILEECLSEFPKHINSFSFGGIHKLYRHDLNHLEMEVNRLREAGETVLHPPWPEPDFDFTEGWLWECYSPEKMRTHAETVYEGALDGYLQLVNTYFPKFADRLKTAVILPANLVGVITPSQLDGSPNLSWYFKVLPKHERHKVNFSFSEQDIPVDKTRLLAELDDRLHSLRPEAVAWMGNTTWHYGGLYGFQLNSATELAYNWLWEDLKRVFWVEGFLGSPPR